MRIGLFGGTFNPVHEGHLQVAREVKQRFDLNRVYLIPAAIPPHKEPGGVAEARARMEMMRLAVQGSQDLTLSDVELIRSGPSYTIDTVCYYKSILPDNTILFLIMGMDAFLEIDTWESYMELFLLVPMIVMSRPESHGVGSRGWSEMAAYLSSKISGGYEYCSKRSCYVHPEKQPIYRFKVTPIDISATKIRDLIKTNQPIDGMVPDTVVRFIKAKGLYL